MKTVPVLFLLLAPLLTSCSELYRPVDCSDIRQRDNSSPSGVYTIYPLGERSAVQVYCDMDSSGGGWTVFQRRMDGTVNFYRPWDYYKFGFGDPAGEYWLGLDKIYYLTNQRKYELLVDMQDFDGKKVFARYSSFSIRDSLSGHSGQKFSTFDKDQDSAQVNCARLHLGAFWYISCFATNPNGVYRWGADGTLYAVGVEWYQWKGHDYSLKSISMKIRPVHIEEECLETLSMRTTFSSEDTETGWMTET
ncbi:microfibril-associated glycoprotein 4-like [Anabas testudineus]|uniref:microfibril-associated glycoprotein 4-like n=1 Tax=Anabas testudineus TaxID=64144 RepID=UPI000E465E7A|nr:microfibril-associated glycoprotein 4-like [Anabas testudineus]